MPRILLASRMRSVATTRGKTQIIDDSGQRVLGFIPYDPGTEKSQSINNLYRVMVEIAGIPSTKIVLTTDCNLLAIEEP